MVTLVTHSSPGAGSDTGPMGLHSGFGALTSSAGSVSRSIQVRRGVLGLTGGGQEKRGSLAERGRRAIRHRLLSAWRPAAWQGLRFPASAPAVRG